MHNLFHHTATLVFSDTSLIGQFFTPILCQQEMASLTNQPDVACTFQATIDGKFATLIGLRVAGNGQWPGGQMRLYFRLGPPEISKLLTLVHTCDISRFRRELPIWSLSSRSHAQETKPPDERFFQCHFPRTVFQSEHFIVYGSIYLVNKLFTAQKCLTFIDMTIDACQH